MTWSRYLTAATLISVAHAAIAEDIRYIEIDPSTVGSTVASGPQGSHEAETEPGRHAWMYGLTFDETGDEPCYIKAHFWRFTKADTEQDFETTFNVCGGNPKGDKSVILPNAVRDRHAITSIQVCTNKKKNTRLKGVEIKGGYIDRNGLGNVTSSKVSRKFDRTNCGDWRKERSCADGKAAVGFRVEYNSDEIVGIALHCAKPRIQLERQLTADPKYRSMENDIRVQVRSDGLTQTMSIDDAIARHRVAGVSVSVVENRRVTGTYHYGLRDFKNNLPTNASTLYQAASMSKFVASLAMVKADGMNHGPRLGRRVSKTAEAHSKSILNDWERKKFKKDVEDYPEDISIRRLLNHTAGLSQHGIGTSTEDCVTEIKSILMGKSRCGRSGTEPLHKPGTIYDYSGGGYTVAEHMLELHSGRSAGNFLNNEILVPYGMSRSTFNTANSDMTNLARGCSQTPCPYEVKHTIAKFAGGMLALPADYGHLLALVLNDGKDSGGRQVIPFDDLSDVMTPAWHHTSSLDQCKTDSQCSGSEQCLTGKCRKPIMDDEDWYGLGIGLSTELHNGYSRELSHGGAQSGFRNDFWLDRKDGTGVVIFVNGLEEWTSSGVTYGGGELADEILSAFKRNY